MKYIGLTFLLFLSSILATAQILKPVSWSFSTEKIDEESYYLVFDADIEEGWAVYSQYLESDDGPIATTISFEDGQHFELLGKAEEDPANRKEAFDPLFDMNLAKFFKHMQIRQKVKVTDISQTVTGSLTFMTCDDTKCLPPEDVDFSFFFDENKSGLAKSKPQTSSKSGGKYSLTMAADEDEIIIPTTSQPESSLWGFAVLAFLAGLAGLLTPCVFPMIPMTVTFFSQGSESKGKAIRNAVVYGLSIIAIYTIAGTIVAKVNGPEFANWLSTHWVPNIFFFVVFVVFAMSFLGMFEIVLPSSWVNKVDQQADKGGLYGAFFMAFTLVLVSFSCTGPIVGSILVESAGGQILKPIVGMFSFSLAFAIPFTLFAIFPDWLNSLPKSGGWLNSVKVVLGFLELALGLKFLSVADQVYHWGILDREVYLALWIVIFALIGFYLLGKIRLPHDSPLEKVGVPRLMLAIASFSFVVYLIPGMFGAPLKSLAGYLPPMSTHDYNLPQLIAQNNTGYTQQAGIYDICEEPKFADMLHFPHGIKGYFDLDQALSCAKKQNKPVFIDFTGHGCVNCREMEARVWSDPEVLRRLKNDYVVVALYVDEKTELPESEWYTSTFDNKVKKTIGKQNADFQITAFNNNAQPYYVLMDHNQQPILEPKAYDLSVQNFVDYLDAGKKQFQSQLSLGE